MFSNIQLATPSNEDNLENLDVNLNQMLFYDFLMLYKLKGVIIEAG